MKQEDKDLLLKDLCVRLPYGVKISINNNFPMVLNQIFYSYGLVGKDHELYSLEHFVIKPYLFPLSSMTDEQKKEWNKWKHLVPVCHYEYGDIVEEDELWDSPASFQYLIENHFDCNDLIPLGLAIDCTNLNIY